MSPGDVVLISLPPLGGAPPKLRPALLLAYLPGPYQNLLLCGISTQLQHLQADGIIVLFDAGLEGAGLKPAPIARISVHQSTTG